MIKFSPMNGLIGLVFAFFSTACESSTVGLPSTNGDLGGNSGIGGTVGDGGKANSGVGGTNGSGGTTGSGLACPVKQVFSCPTVDGSSVLSNLQPAEAAAFCDCRAAYSGGYGALMCICPDGSSSGLLAPQSQAACLSGPAAPSGCTLTVNQYAACINAMWSEPCDDTTITTALSDVNCQIFMTKPCAG